MMRWSRRGVGVALLFPLLLAACGTKDVQVGAAPAPTATPAPSGTPTHTLGPTDTPEATVTATPEPTAEATATTAASPTASATPVPTETMPPTPTPTETVVPEVIAFAKRVTGPEELIGGPMARGRVGDYLMANDKIRVIIRDVGRQFGFLLTYGGNIIDADRVRAPGEPDRDSFEAMTPLINIASTVNVQQIEIINDGSNGEPAVIRTTGVDDLLDAIDPTNAIRSFGVGSVPPSAQDKDIPVEIVTEYTLSAHDEFVNITTTVKNTGTEILRLYAGDFVNGSGELDLFVPGMGFGEVVLRPRMPFLAYAGLGRAAGVSYGIIPISQPSSGFSQSGVTAYLAGQELINVLLFQTAGALVVPPGGTNSYERLFIVGSGDIGSVVDEQNRALGIEHGRVGGRVTVAGRPAAGARVAVVRVPGQNGSAYNVLGAFRTDADGYYAGTLASGAYRLMVKLDGHPYDSGTTAPEQVPITVTTGMLTTQDFELPDTGSLRVTVTDHTGAPLVSKVSIVGFDASPDPTSTQNLVGFSLTGFVFGSDIKQKGSVMFGVPFVAFTDVDGDTGTFPLAPGEYGVVVSHGPEYSAVTERVTITSGETTTLTAQLAPVVDTAGFVSADYHVHMLNSPDSAVTVAERIMTMVAEGVEHFIASDHDFLTDVRPEIERLGLQDRVASGISDEITTFNIGHFNIWPLSIDPNSINGGAVDWGRSGVPPGQDYPSLGSYDLSPAEIFASGPPGSVKQVNHFNSSVLGYFAIGGIDSALRPPQSFTDPARIRQDPAIPNLYDDGYTALELWIEGSRSETALLLDANFGDWFNLLNQGIVKTATSDSDTHTTAVIQAGGPRNFVASSTDAPGEIDNEELARNVNDGRVIGSNAPFVRFTVEGDGGEVAGLALGMPRVVRATGGSATVRLHVQSPIWAEFDSVELYVNTVPAPVPDQNYHGVTVPRYTVSPTLRLVAGADFTIDTVDVHPEIAGAARFQADITQSLEVSADAWVVAVVRGTDGVSKPLWPMNPQDLDHESNATLDDLLDGNLGEGGVPALAYTNPLFIDADGNGQFDPPAVAR